MDRPHKDTPQLRFWRGEFGTHYIGRNEATQAQLRARVALWADILRTMPGAPPASILEVGCNIGNNLRALAAVSNADLWGMEPNDMARMRLVEDGVVPAARALDGAAQAIPLGDGAVDMAFTSGVLIHIHPDDLPDACREMYRVAKRYVACVEYFSPNAEEIPYRGHNERLFRRDFGGLFLDMFPDLQTLGTGFAWKRTTGLDNLTWWVFEKRG